MRGLKVLTACTLLILLTSMQCNTAEKGIARDTSVKTYVHYDEDSTNARLQIKIDYTPKELRKKTDSIQFVFGYVNSFEPKLVVLTDYGPFLNKKQSRLLEKSLQIAIPQNENYTDIYVSIKVYKKHRYLESQRVPINTVYRSKKKK